MGAKPPPNTLQLAWVCYKLVIGKNRRVLPKHVFLRMGSIWKMGRSSDRGNSSRGDARLFYLYDFSEEIGFPACGRFMCFFDMFRDSLKKQQKKGKNHENIHGRENRYLFLEIIEITSKGAHRDDSDSGGPMSSPSSIWSPFVKKSVLNKLSKQTCFVVTTQHSVLILNTKYSILGTEY